MSDWTDGYVTDINYNYSFFPELAPVNIAFSLLESGFHPPSLDKFQYCELGCGQGFSTNILAAANPQGEFWANDFNPTHMAEAKRLAHTAKLDNIHFFDDSFEEFLEADIPQFDFITLHGVYSWIDDANRHLIVEFIRRKLKVGGAVYIGYNTLPGWSPMIPLRELMVNYADTISGPSIERMDKAIAFIEQLKTFKADFFRVNPIVAHEFDELKTESRSYLVHEYLNKDWKPLYHLDVARQLSAAKLTFATSAELDDQFDNLGLGDKKLKFIASISNLELRETVRDYFFNRRFRRDIFVKGPVKLTQWEQTEWIGNTRFALLTPPHEIEYEVSIGDGTMKLAEAIYTPLILALAEHPQTLKELLQRKALKTVDFSALRQALVLLASLGHVAPTSPGEGDRQRQASTQRFNTAVLNAAPYRQELQVLASPILGSGLVVNRSEQLMLLARQRQANPVDFIWKIMQVQGKRLTKDGTVLQSAQDNQTEIKCQDKEFSSYRLPIMENLGIP